MCSLFHEIVNTILRTRQQHVRSYITSRCTLADVNTVFSLRDYAVQVMVGAKLSFNLVISAMKPYQSSHTATCLGAGLQHTPIVPFNPDR
jgi:hypothetical protein